MPEMNSTITMGGFSLVFLGVNEPALAVLPHGGRDVAIIVFRKIMQVSALFPGKIFRLR